MKNFQSHYDELKSLLRNESGQDKDALRESFEIAMEKAEKDINLLDFDDEDRCTPALTTLGMNESDMKEVASIIDFVLRNTKPGVTKDGKPAKGKIVLDKAAEANARERVNALLGEHKLYPELDLDFLKKEFVR